MTELLAQSLRTLEGAVTGVGLDGHVTVAVDGGALRCLLLETSAGPPLRLEPGDRVLVASFPAVASGEASGFVLGRIALHTHEAPAEAPRGTPDRQTVHVVMPEGVETVRIAGTRVRIAADEELTLECGGASVRIDRRGKVVVLGTDVTTRARRLHKIKGASVAIN